jgi:hypothetical protein
VKVPIGRKVIVRRGVKVREIAAPAAADQDFLADLRRVFEQQDAASTLSSREGAK